ncbi:MAG TPA: ATP synthase F1 subunit gamma [Chthoniobacterales bacterium]|jgi:F-type H+-transporting ATPase subunit gamma|nr:ATP synthase F1 subunit gamma [Chthoniobacterales bacterium]
MPSTLDLRRRIKSVKNTAQITKAMQMVAASKMRKAQAAAIAGRPYQEMLARVLAAVKGRVDPGDHELLAVRPVQNELILIFSTDKGLCGPLNANLFRELGEVDREKSEFAVSGRKAVQFITRTRRNLTADFALKDTIEFSEIRPIAKFVSDKFISGEVDQVRVLYSKFVNTLVQQPVLRALLPIPVEELGIKGPQGPGEYLFEPDEQSVLDAILPHYLAFQLFQMALDARASEHSARMVAMKNATDNAKELIKDLTLEYNKVRQANITTELLEITTAQLAVG